MLQERTRSTYNVHSLHKSLQDKHATCRVKTEHGTHCDDVVANLAVLRRHKLVVEEAGDRPQDVVGHHQRDQLVLRHKKHGRESVDCLRQ